MKVYNHYYILTRSPHFATVIEWVKKHDLKVLVHINRTRFFIESNSPAHTEFLLRFSDHCPEVVKGEDLATGFVNLES